MRMMMGMREGREGGCVKCFLNHKYLPLWLRASVQELGIIRKRFFADLKKWIALYTWKL